jgi:arabinofuranosyltransferase
VERPRTQDLLLVGLAVLVFVVISGAYYPHGFFDDSYIGLRYVRNLVRGHGLAWNPGEPPVDGCTSLGWVWLLSAFGISGIAELEELARGVGIALGGIGLVLSWVLARALLPSESKGLALLVPAHLALTPLFSRSAINGMETLLTAVLVLGAALPFVLRRERERPWVWGLAGAMAFAAVLARPDALLFPIAMACCESVRTWRRGEGTRGPLAAYAASLGLPLAALLAWKQVYFGGVVPLPAYMKLRVDRLLETPALYKWVVVDWLGFVPWVAPLIIVIALAAAAGRNALEGPARSLAIATAVYAAYFLLVLPVMNEHWRFEVPLYAPLVVLAVLALARLLESRGAAAWPSPLRRSRSCTSGASTESRSRARTAIKGTAAMGRSARHSPTCPASPWR